jgi:hypothetical protein
MSHDHLLVCKHSNRDSDMMPAPNVEVCHKPATAEVQPRNTGDLQASEDA